MVYLGIDRDYSQEERRDDAGDRWSCWGIESCLLEIDRRGWGGLLSIYPEDRWISRLGIGLSLMERDRGDVWVALLTNTISCSKTILC